MNSSFITKLLKNNFTFILSILITTVAVVNVANAATYYFTIGGSTVSTTTAVTDPLAQGLSGCTPGNCGISSAAATLTLPVAVTSGGTGTSTAPTYGQVLLGNALGGFDLVSTSSLGIAGALSNFFTNLFATNFYASTTNATTTNTINLAASGSSTLASTTVTNLTGNNFAANQVIAATSSISNLNVLSTLWANLLSVIGITATNATFTGATTTNLAVTNGVGVTSGGTGTTTAPGYGQFLVGDGTGKYMYAATSSLAVASSSFASSTALGATVTNAVNTGIFFLNNGVLTQDTANFNYDNVTKKLTVTGGIDPLFTQVKDTFAGNAAYFEAFDGSNAATSTTGNGRLRYNATTSQWEVSVNGGSYQPIQVTGGNITWLNATGTNATITNIYASGSFSLPNGSIVGASITNATITNSTSTNLYPDTTTMCFYHLLCNIKPESSTYNICFTCIFCSDKFTKKF
jgi:hypothetical protein